MLATIVYTVCSTVGATIMRIVFVCYIKHVRVVYSVVFVCIHHSCGVHTMYTMSRVSAVYTHTTA